MFHDQHILTNGMYLPFLCLVLTNGMYLPLVMSCSHKWHVFTIFMPCPELPMGISSVGSFPVWSGGSLNIFQLLRCRNLALNRFFPPFP